MCGGGVGISYSSPDVCQSPQYPSKLSQHHFPTQAVNERRK